MSRLVLDICLVLLWCPAIIVSHTCTISRSTLVTQSYHASHQVNATTSTKCTYKVAKKWCRFLTALIFLTTKSICRFLSIRNQYLLTYYFMQYQKSNKNHSGLFKDVSNQSAFTFYGPPCSRINSNDKVKLDKNVFANEITHNLITIIVQF